MEPMLKLLPVCAKTNAETNIGFNANADIEADVNVNADAKAHAVMQMLKLTPKQTLLVCFGLLCCFMVCWFD